MKFTTSRRLLLFGGAFALLAGTAMAQDYYDDDIYFDASKSKKAKTERRASVQTSAPKTVTSTSRSVSSQDSGSTFYGVPLHYGQSASGQTATVGSTRDVDEYNRRGSYKPVKEQSADLGDNFTYTRRIEQFSNPDIVVNSDDDDLKYYYTYANDELAATNGYTAPATINIYVDNYDPWDNFWNPYYYSSAWSWAWRPTYYNPWWSYNYYWGFGPSWSIGWNSWWGPSFNWTWGPAWGWTSPSWGWGTPSWGWNPPRPPHPHPGNGWNNGGHRPGGWAGPGGTTAPGRRPGSTISSGRTGNRSGLRPSGMRPSTRLNNGGSSSSSGRRPSAGSYGTSSGRNNGSTVSGVRSSSTPRSSSSGSSTRSSSGYRSSSSSSSSGRSSGSYNSSRSSSGSYRSSGSSFGGSRSSGGGGSRSSGGGRSGRH